MAEKQEHQGQLDQERPILLAVVAGLVLVEYQRAAAAEQPPRFGQEVLEERLL